MNSAPRSVTNYRLVVVSDASESTDELSGSGLLAEKARRLERVRELRDRGDNPYPYRFEVDIHHLARPHR